MPRHCRAAAFGVTVPSTTSHHLESPHLIAWSPHISSPGVSTSHRLVSPQLIAWCPHSSSPGVTTSQHCHHIPNAAALGVTVSPQCGFVASGVTTSQYLVPPTSHQLVSPHLGILGVTTAQHLGSPQLSIDTCSLWSPHIPNAAAFEVTVSQHCGSAASAVPTAQPLGSSHPDTLSAVFRDVTLRCICSLWGHCTPALNICSIWGHQDLAACVCSIWCPHISSPGVLTAHHLESPHLITQCPTSHHTESPHLGIWCPHISALTPAALGVPTSQTLQPLGSPCPNTARPGLLHPTARQQRLQTPADPHTPGDMPPSQGEGKGIPDGASLCGGTRGGSDWSGCNLGELYRALFWANPSFSPLLPQKQIHDPMGPTWLLVATPSHGLPDTGESRLHHTSSPGQVFPPGTDPANAAAGPRTEKASGCRVSPGKRNPGLN